MTLPAAIVLLALGADSFAVSIGVGVREGERARIWRTGLVFALAEALMPLVGWVIGSQLSRWLGTWMSAIGALLLVGLGLYEWFVDDDDDDDDEPREVPPRRGFPLLLAALSVSIDELVLGVSLSSLGVSLVTAVVWLFVQAIAGSALGIKFGRVLGRRFAERIEKSAAVALILVGVYLGLSLLV